MNKFKFSKYTHILSRGNKTAYYNSLYLKPVFVDNDYCKRFEYFNSWFGREDFILKFKSKKEEKNYSQILTDFIKNKILISDSLEDEEYQKEQIAKISEPNIHVAFFLLTNECNFACKYCYVRDPKKSNFTASSMTKNIAKKGLDFYIRQIQKNKSVMHYEKAIVFYGGEPLLNFPVMKYLILKIAEYKNAGKIPLHLRLLMVTNGSLMTEEKADLLKQHNVTVTFSIDGEDEENALRIFKDGSPGFDSTLKGYKICREKGLDLNIACTLTPLNISKGTRTINSFVEKYKAKNVGFNMLLDNGCEEVPDWYNKQASEFIISAHKIFSKHGIRENRMARKLKAFNKSEVYLYDCMAGGGRQIAIAPDGGIGICHEDTWNKKNYVTNVDEKYFDPAENKVFLEWAERTPINMKECQKCIALGICGGGCIINAKYKGSIWKIDERFCTQAKTILEYLIWNRDNTLLN